MDDRDKTKEQLIEELETLRAQLAGVEAEHEQTRKQGEALLDVVVGGIRTPLTYVLGFSELATEMIETGEPDLAELAKCLGMSRDAAERAMKALETAKRVSQFVFGDRPLNLTSFALGEVVGQVQAEFQSEADDKGIELTVTAPEEAEPMLADEEIVRQVVGLMLDNALRFTSRGGQVSVEVKPVPEGQQVSVVESSPGRFLLPDSLRWMIVPRPGKGWLDFTFYRLAIEAHGGRVWAEDVPTGVVTLACGEPAPEVNLAFHFILPARQV